MPFSRTIRPDDRYVWTRHALNKLAQYHLSPSRIKRVISRPERVEEGIAENTVAAMQAKPGRQYAEIWAMYVVTDTVEGKKFRIITAWIYPAKSPERDPIPPDVMREIEGLLHE